MEIMIPTLQDIGRIGKTVRTVGCDVLSVDVLGAGGRETSMALAWVSPVDLGADCSLHPGIAPGPHATLLAFPTRLPHHNMLNWRPALQGPASC